MSRADQKGMKDYSKSSKKDHSTKEAYVRAE
jgi:hypothetical protein